MADIRHLISIDARMDRIFPPVASGNGFARWWAADALEEHSTGFVEVAFFNRATVTASNPIHKSISSTTEWMCQTGQAGQEWTGKKLLFELTETSGGTNLRFTHADWRTKTEHFVSCAKVWGELMLRLRAAAEGAGLGSVFSRGRLGF
jgi:hypothetical protein